MRHIRAGVPLVGLLVLLLSQTVAAAPPPPEARPLSEILRMIEEGGGVAHFDEIEWDDGHWEIKLVRPDGSKDELKIDPVTGQPRR